MILALDTVTAVYGSSTVLQGVSLEVPPGQTVALLGRNGAGKTTTLRSVMGLVRVPSGQVRFRGEELRGRQPFEIARRGIGYVPDDRRIFPHLTVEENLRFGAQHSRRSGTWNLARVCELFPHLRQLLGRGGATLSGGEQKMLAIGRALMGNPELLMLDEPSEGLSPLIVTALVAAIRRVRSEGITLLIADQNLKFARQVAEFGYIVEKGAIQFRGTMESLWGNEELVRKHLAV